MTCRLMAVLWLAARMYGQEGPSSAALDQARMLETLPRSPIAECNSCRQTNIQRLRSGQAPISTPEMVTCRFNAPPADTCGICAKKMCENTPGPVAPAPPATPGPGPTPPVRPAEDPPAAPLPRPAPTDAAQPPPPAQPYSGPKSGIINWSGLLEKGGTFTVEGERALTGQVLYGALPGLPVVLEFDSTEFALAESPGPRNQWNRLTIRSLRRRHSVVSIKWTLLQ